MAQYLRAVVRRFQPPLFRNQHICWQRALNHCTNTKYRIFWKVKFSPTLCNLPFLFIVLGSIGRLQKVKQSRNTGRNTGRNRSVTERRTEDGTHVEQSAETSNKSQHFVPELFSSGVLKKPMMATIVSQCAYDSHHISFSHFPYFAMPSSSSKWSCGIPQLHRWRTRYPIGYRRSSPPNGGTRVGVGCRRV